MVKDRLRRFIREQVVQQLREQSGLEGDISAVLSWSQYNADKARQVGGFITRIQHNLKLLHGQRATVGDDVEESWLQLKLAAERFDEKIQRLAKRSGVTK